MTDTQPRAADNRAPDHATAGRVNTRWLFLALASLAGFVLLTAAVASRVVFPFDQSLLALAHSWDGQPDIWKAITETANIPLIVIGLGFVSWLFLTKRRREAILVLVMLAAVTVGSEAVKQLTLRPRPVAGTAAGIPGVIYSYPSGHVLEALTILGFVTLRVWRSARPLVLRVAVAIAVAVEVVLVGIARLVLEAHYPTDILAGVLAGIGALGLYAWWTRPGAWADQPTSAGGPTAESGPLGPVDPVQPGIPGTVVRPSPTAATATVVIGLAGLIASLIVLGSIAEGVRTQEVFALDTWATPFLHGIASPGLDLLMNTLTDVGSSPIIVPGFVAVVVWLLWKRRYGATSFLTVASGGALIIQGTMKLFFQRPRPQLGYAHVLPDYSFPSGHTMNAVVFYIALALILWSVFGQRVGRLGLAVAVVLAFAVGASRIYLGYHYLTDVVGGLLAGIAWLLVVGAAFHARPAWWRWGSEDAPETSQPDGPDSAAVR